MREFNNSTADDIDLNVVTTKQLALHVYHEISDGKVVTVKKLGNLLFHTNGNKHRENKTKESAKLRQALDLLEPFLITDTKGVYSKSYHVRGWVTEPVIIQHLEGLT